LNEHSARAHVKRGQKFLVRLAALIVLVSKYRERERQAYMFSLFRAPQFHEANCGEETSKGVVIDAITATQKNQQRWRRGAASVSRGSKSSQQCSLNSRQARSASSYPIRRGLGLGTGYDQSHWLQWNASTMGASALEWRMIFRVLGGQTTPAFMPRIVPENYWPEVQCRRKSSTN
jgi:hypothetical protein